MSKMYVTATVRMAVNTDDDFDEVESQLADRFDQISEIESGFVTVLDTEVTLEDVK